MRLLIEVLPLIFKNPIDDSPNYTNTFACIWNDSKFSFLSLTICMLDQPVNLFKKKQDNKTVFKTVNSGKSFGLGLT